MDIKLTPISGKHLYELSKRDKEDHYYNKNGDTGSTARAHIHRVIEVEVVHWKLVEVHLVIQFAKKVPFASTFPTILLW